MSRHTAWDRLLHTRRRPRLARNSAKRTYIASFALDLDRTVQDLELLGNNRSDVIKQFPVPAYQLIVNDDMGAHGIDAGGYGPDMDMVCFAHAFYLCDLRGNRFDIDMGRHGLEQDVHGFLHQCPGAVQ